MTKRGRASHERSLDYLCHHVHLIGESREDLAWVIKEPIWHPDGKIQQYSMPDLIAYFYTDKYLVVELKANGHDSSKAKRQLMQGRRFLEQMFDVEPHRIVRKLVIYNGLSYDWKYIGRQR